MLTENARFIKKNFTFRKEPRETGLRGVGHPYPNTIVKLAKLKVGTIYAPTWRDEERTWSVSLAVQEPVTDENPCPFRWIRFKARFETEEAARRFLIANRDAILRKYPLYAFED